MERILIGIGIVFIILLFTFIIIRNMFIGKKKRVERNSSLVDVFLKKRYDLIPNLIEVCEFYSKYESETLQKIAELRSSFEQNPNEKVSEELNTHYQKLIALVEAYPEIKTSEQYLKLQHELTEVENELQASRRIYINSVTSYNNLVMQFPSSIVARICNYKEIALPKYEYENVNVNIEM